jgi:hypothetical protein
LLPQRLCSARACAFTSSGLIVLSDSPDLVCRYNYQGVLDLSLLILNRFVYTQNVNQLKRHLPIITAGIEFYSNFWTKLDENGTYPPSSTFFTAASAIL